MQNRLTRCFLSKQGEWSPNLEKARDFKASTEAVTYSVANHLEDVQIVLHFDSAPRYDVELRLG